LNSVKNAANDVGTRTQEVANDTGNAINNIYDIGQGEINDYYNQHHSSSSSSPNLHSYTNQTNTTAPHLVDTPANISHSNSTPPLVDTPVNSTSTVQPFFNPSQIVIHNL